MTAAADGSNVPFFTPGNRGPIQQAVQMPTPEETPTVPCDSLPKTIPVVIGCRGVSAEMTVEYPLPVAQLSLLRDVMGIINTIRPNGLSYAFFIEYAGSRDYPSA